MEKRIQQSYPISLSIICKDETDSLDKMLASAAPYVDEIVVAWNGTNPETEKILQKYNAVIHKYEWQDDFSHARNFCLEKCSNPYVLWLDSDDILVGGEKMQEHCKVFEDPMVGSIWMFYNYDQDKYGNCISELSRERIFRRDWFKWEGMIHEEAMKRVDCIPSKIDKNEVYVLHQTSGERIQQSAIRNLEISRKAYEKGGDVAAVWYYAKSLIGVGHTEEAIPIFEQFIDLTDSDEHRYDALNTLASLYRNFQKIAHARHYNMKAIDLKPDWPMAYFGMAENHLFLNNWQEIIYWTNLGFKLKHPSEALPMVWNPRDFSYRPLEPLCMAMVQTGRFKEAHQIALKGLEIHPESPYFKPMAEKLPKLIYQQKVEEACLEVYNYLEESGEDDKLKYFAAAIPSVAEDYPVLKRLQNRFTTFGDSKGKKVVFYCGTSYEMWDDSSLTTGIGGSEEATVHIARQLAHLGWDVEVFNPCKKPGTRQGVKWTPLWEYDQSVPCDIFIIWRDARNVLLAPENAYVALWLHDVQKTEYYNEEILSKIDKFFVLSNWHRHNLPPSDEHEYFNDDKFFVTRNGIQSKQFDQVLPRNSKRCVYASSPDRGLDRLLAMWPEIIKEVPDAELHIYYGFTATYEKMHGQNSKMMKFRDDILEACKQPGVVYHGRVGQDVLAQEFLQSALWLYPTQFQEISCITAMKAQAAGMIPVTMTTAALNETVQYGDKFAFNIADLRTQEAFIRRTINLLKNPEEQEKVRSEMIPWAKQTYDWSVVANEWSEFFKTDLRVDTVGESEAVQSVGAETVREPESGRASNEIGVGVEGDDSSSV